MLTPSKLLPAGPMARRLRVPVKWLKAEAAAGRVPHLEAGRAILFEPDAVEAVLVERARQGLALSHNQRPQAGEAAR